MNHTYELIERGSKEFPVGLFAQTVYLDKPHHHIEYEIFYLQNGRAVFGIEGLEHNLFPGDTVFIDPMVNHYAKSVIDGEIYHYIAMVFDASLIGQPGESSRQFFDSIRIKRYPSLPRTILTQLEEATEMEKNKAEGRACVIKAVLYNIVAHIIQTKQYEVVSLLEAGSKPASSAIDTALQYIRVHFKETIMLDDILKLTNYSTSHFLRLFKEQTGLSVTEYINKYRIEKACLDLIYTDKNITEIATENGFNSIQYFSRTFKEHMNCTPKQYQKNGRTLVVPSSLAAVSGGN